MPPPPAFASSAETQAYYNSPEWRELTKQSKNYAFVVKPDGTFSIEDVVPGGYVLNISVRPGGNDSWSHSPLAQGHIAVTVPDSASPSLPINVGEVLLTPNQQR